MRPPPNHRSPACAPTCGSSVSRSVTRSPLDATGRVADGYQVQDQPWFVLTSPSGHIVWHHDGWLPLAALLTAARHG
ncbi:MAG: hypothetical protein ACM3ML_28165 [Micromonosporaceae bacterium]